MPSRLRKKRRSNASRAVLVDDAVEDVEEDGNVEEEVVILEDADGDAVAAEEGEDEGEAEEGPTEEQIEEWEAFREEYYEVHNELPVSLHRSYNLMRELDEQVDGHLVAQLPAVKAYIAFRRARLAPPPPLPTVAAPIDTPPDASTSAGLPDQPESSSSTHVSPADQDACQAPHVNGITESPNPRKRKRSSEAETSPPRRSPRGVSQSTTLSRVSSRSSQTSKSSSNPITPDSKNTNGVLSSGSPSPTKAGQAPAVPLPKTEPEPANVITRKMLSRISTLASESMRASDEKIGIAKAMYDLVDRHVRSLDAKIKEYEASVAIGLRLGTHPMDGTLTFDGLDEPTEPRNRRKKDKKGKRRATEEDEDMEEDMPSDIIAGGIQMPVMDMEPVYCYCHRVSFGEMVGCDGDNCPHGGWFHLDCVGMTVAPKGSWYCSACENERGQPKKKRKH